MFQPGTILDGKYEIISQIGSGGGGEIYRAYHKRLKKYVAIKRIKENVRGKLNERTEADILKSLKHQYLPQVYDFITTNDEVYTVMEYIEGCSFQDALSSGKRFSQKQVIKYAKQICEALNYLHTRKPAIIHSDIKPANIMLTNDNNICLIDFNISSAFGGGELYAIGKSDGYSPPEQYIRRTAAKVMKTSVDKTEIIDDETEIIDDNKTGSFFTSDKTEIIETYETEKNSSSASFASVVVTEKKIIDERSDIYAFGATLYHLISGVRPGKSIDGVIPLDKLDVGISEGLLEIITKAMNISPNMRYENAGEMLSALENIDKLDHRYKRIVFLNRLLCSFFIICFSASIVVAMSGYRRIGTEKEEKYQSLVEKSEEYILSGDEENFNKIFDEANSLFSNRLDIYYRKALMMYYSGDYLGTFEFIDKTLGSNTGFYSHNDIADTLFLSAECLFELEDYENSLSYYKSAIDKKSDNVAYFRGYAIALARTGDISGAADVLEKAKEKGLSEADIYLVDGEINFISEKYVEAEKSLLECIKKLDNDDVKQRAYILCSKVYSADQSEENIKKNITLLEEAKKKLPSERSFTVNELLASAYMNAGNYFGDKSYFEKAISVFDEMNKQGFESYSDTISLAMLYRKVGKYDLSKKTLLSADEKFGGNYRTKMYLAYLEIEIQSEYSNKDRNYKEFENYYKESKKLYDENYTDGGRSVDGPSPVEYINEDIDSGFAKIINRAMQQKPSKRYANVEDMLDVLEGLNIKEKAKKPAKVKKIKKEKESSGFKKTPHVIGLVATVVVISGVLITVGTIGIDKENETIKTSAKTTVQKTTVSKTEPQTRVYKEYPYHKRISEREIRYYKTTEDLKANRYSRIDYYDKNDKIDSFILCRWDNNEKGMEKLYNADGKLLETLIANTVTTIPEMSPAEERYVNDIFLLLNQERARKGLNELILDKKLTDAANIRVKELSIKYDLDYRPDGRRWGTVLDETGVYWTRANWISSYGYETKDAAQHLVDLLSDEKYKNVLLDEEYTRIGIGYDESTKYFLLIMVDY